MAAQEATDVRRILAHVENNATEQNIVSGRSCRSPACFSWGGDSSLFDPLLIQDSAASPWPFCLNCSSSSPRPPPNNPPTPPCGGAAQAAFAAPTSASSPHHRVK